MCSFHATLPALWSFVIPYIFVHNLTLFWAIVFNKFQTLVWGCTEIPGGECHRHWKWDTKDTKWFMHGGVRETGHRSGMPADVQACQHNSIVHVQRYFPPKVLKQMTVMSFGDVTDILLMYIGEGIKGSIYETKGFFGSGSQFCSVVQFVAS